MRYSGCALSRLGRQATVSAFASTILLAALPAFATDVVTDSAIPFRLAHDFAVIVPVIVNGSGPYDFLLDTGSSQTSVDSALSHELHLHPVPGGSVTTVTGSRPVEVARIESLAAGTMKFAETEVLVRNLHALRSLDRSLRGVLGQDALRQTDYLLDYRHRVLRFDEDGELLRSLDGERLALTPVGAHSGLQYGSTLVETSVRDGHRMLVLDSGSASLVLFEKDLPPGPAFATGDLRDDYGQLGEARIEKTRLCVGRSCQEAAAWSVAGRVFPGIDGLLPTWLFPSLYVCNSGGFAMFAPRRRRAAPDDMASLRAGSAPAGGR